eukprot:3703282-Pyramimonas_sp.AAC.1
MVWFCFGFSVPRPQLHIPQQLTPIALRSSRRQGFTQRAARARSPALRLCPPHARRHIIKGN